MASSPEMGMRSLTVARSTIVAVPPWASAIARTIASPSPAPLPVRVAPPRAKRSNARGASSGGSRGPRRRHRSRSPPPPGAQRDESSRHRDAARCRRGSRAPGGPERGPARPGGRRTHRPGSHDPAHRRDRRSGGGCARAVLRRRPEPAKPGAGRRRPGRSAADPRRAGPGVGLLERRDQRFALAHVVL